MNSQIQFETNGLRVLVVKVPEDSKDLFINNVGCLRYSTMQGKLSKCIEPEQLGVYLDEKWKILCTTDAMTEEQSQIIVVCYRLSQHCDLPSVMALLNA